MWVGRRWGRRRGGAAGAAGGRGREPRGAGTSYLARYFGGVFGMQEGWCDLQACEVPALHGLFKVLLIFFLMTARRRRRRRKKKREKKKAKQQIFITIFSLCAKLGGCQNQWVQLMLNPLPTKTCEADHCFLWK